MYLLHFLLSQQTMEQSQFTGLLIYLIFTLAFFSNDIDESHSVGVHLRNIGYFNKNLKRMSIILERDLLALRSDALFPNATVLKVE